MYLFSFSFEKPSVRQLLQSLNNNNREILFSAV